MTRYAKLKKKYEEAGGFNVTPLIPEQGDRVSEGGEGQGGKRASEDKQEFTDNRGRDLLVSNKKIKTNEKQKKIILTKSERSEKRRLRRIRMRQNKTVCFGCRKIGHSVINCPSAKEKGVGVCYNCGSPEHTTKDCKKSIKQGDSLTSQHYGNQHANGFLHVNDILNLGDKYQYAKCFVCNEQGHLSGKCPQNDKGLYPKGGGCRFCGKVDHLAKDCTLKKEDVGTSFIGKIDLHHGADDDDFHIFVGEKDDFKKGDRNSRSARDNVKPKKKIINFS
ncbi:10768_t:CDS:2 [Acaulospora colombiana]|uniref:10768_t:CDS:1 n=1 Tax=Acaulospora colombiana TaxID=27376 RepID=A0ACA9K253_9GLOM|nr:10768_t:CDS:2 [Acaulospora colombiana]